VSIWCVVDFLGHVIDSKLFDLAILCPIQFLEMKWRKEG
jgi:hypothetical protein